ncbi:MAG TPA: TIGR04063 family PEP-CTERM/XrtA system glycosyltransferase [Burkholderiales bacterium]|nr:TIGR04063 family PEP-CTERM/XrtA system glycosyltransferase [Burkholderiales bacterium]
MPPQTVKDATFNAFKVLHVLDHSVPMHSGYSFRTLSILREQRALGWQTFHLTSPKHTAAQIDREQAEGMDFYRTLWQPRGWRKLPLLCHLALMNATTARLRSLALQLRPDLLHAHSPALNALPALRVGRELGIPVVYEVRAFWEDAAVDHGTAREGGIRYRLTRAFETYVMRRVQHVTTICEGLRQDIVARGIPADKVTVIPNAVDVEKFQFDQPGDRALRASLGLEDAVVLGFIGSFYAYEGIDLLLKAAQQLRPRHPKLRLLLVGGGPQEAALKAQAKRLGLDDCVRFVGRVPNNKVQDYYNLIDVLVYARHAMRLTELVTPLKPLEAMAQGKLFVASDVGGHRELVKDRVTGYLFKAGDAQHLAETVEELLRQTEGWPGLRAAGRQHVETERNWKRSVARYQQVFATLTGRAA